MKIVCDACQAKYSISDDKVQGKVFKIRCKKCSNIIVVRGAAGAAEPAPAPQQEKDTRVYDYGYEGSDRAPAGDEAVWHVVINQDQVGPMTADDVRQRHASGEIDSESYVWREGFSDWMPLAQVDTFASLASSEPPVVAARSGGAEAVAAMFAGGSEEAGPGRSEPGDLFAAASASARQDDDGGDLFGSKPVAQPSAGAAKLRGERNENSVLFSLNNLAQLASDKPAAAAAHVPATAGAATGAAGGEGSGLIDIRSMASAYLGAGSGAAKPVSAGIGSIDDLPVFGGGGFSEPAVIVPIAARASNNNKLMYALIGSVGLLAVAAVIVVVVLLRSSDTRPAATAVASQGKVDSPPADKLPSEPRPAEPAATTTPDPTAAAPATGSGAPNAGTPNAGTPASNPRDSRVAAVEPPPDSRRTATTTPSRPTSNPTRSRPAAERTTPAPAAKEPPPAKDTAKDSGKDGTCDEVSCVLNNYEGACCAKLRGGKSGGGRTPSAGGDRPAGKSDLPEGLDKPMISDALGKVKARVMSCSEKSSAKGQVKVAIKVSPEGHVANVTVKNTPDASLGNCVSSMMQKATFPRTQSGGSFAYAYTF